MGPSKRLRLESSLSEDLSDVIRSNVLLNLGSFEKTLQKVLKNKDVEINTLRMKLNSTEKYYREEIASLKENIKVRDIKIEQLNKLGPKSEELMAKMTELDNKNKLLEEENEMLKKTLNKECKSCVENEIDKERLKRHIFKRQAKVKQYKDLLIERDERIEQLESELETNSVDTEELERYQQEDVQKDNEDVDLKSVEVETANDEERMRKLMNMIDSTMDSFKSLDKKGESQEDINEYENDEIDENNLGEVKTKVRKVSVSVDKMEIPNFKKSGKKRQCS